MMRINGDDILYFLRQWQIVIITLVVLIFGLGYSKVWMFAELQDCLKSKITGEFKPHPVLNSFHIRGAAFSIQDKLTVSGGDIFVAYQILKIFPRAVVRVQITSHHAVVSLRGAWHKLYPYTESPLREFYADITLSEGEIQTIHSLILETKDFDFKILPPSELLGGAR